MIAYADTGFLPLLLQHQGEGVFRAESLEKVLVLSRRHSAKLGTRTLDLLHVAAAVLLRPDVFYTFDKRHGKLARAERLRVLPARLRRRLGRKFSRGHEK